MKREDRTSAWLLRTKHLLAAVTLLCAFCHPLLAQSSEKKRERLSSVRKIVVAAPFFGTNTLLGDEPPAKPDKTDRSKEQKPKEKPKPPLSAEERRQREEYEGYLKKLEAHFSAQLRKRLQARAPFTVVPEKETTAAYKKMEFTQVRLFQNNGRLKGTKFPAPEADPVRKLAGEMKADAVLLTVLDEPRRSNGGYYLDGPYINYESAHVRCKAAYYLYLADGTEVLREFVEVLHPLTRIGKKDYILVDWQETEEQVIENFMDELTRYTPSR